MSETLAHAARAAAGELEAAGVEGAMRDAELLLRWATGLDAAALSTRMGDPIGDDARAKFREAIAARAARAPVSHIVGGREFWGRWFAVTPDVLDPRPETETLIAAALDGPRPETVLDLGVGSGCLLGTLLAESPETEGTGVDASRAALGVAARNLETLGVADRSKLVLGDWCDDLMSAFHMIVCNPPYIAEAEMESLSPEVAHEPRLALTPGGDGLDPYRRIAPEMAAFLRKKGRALFEIGPTQAADVASIFASFGWPEPLIHKDFDGRDRCLEWRRP